MNYTSEIKIKFKTEKCPECCNKLTIFCVVPIEGEFKNTLKRFCPRCENIWPM